MIQKHQMNERKQFRSYETYIEYVLLQKHNNSRFNFRPISSWKIIDMINCLV